MTQYTIRVNGQKKQVSANEGDSLLWILREQLGLTGTKYGCGIAQCGACTIHVNGQPMRACITPINMVASDQEIVTIEGLSSESNHPLQLAWAEAQVPQCGYCQSGQIMQAAALLDKNPNPTREEIVEYMDGNLCRCGTYMRILKAIESVANKSMPLSTRG